MGDHEGKVLFDLYSGTGTIGQVMASAAKQDYGIELIEEAMEKAFKDIEGKEEEYK